MATIKILAPHSYSTSMHLLFPYLAPFCRSTLFYQTDRRLTCLLAFRLKTLFKKLFFMLHHANSIPYFIRWPIPYSGFYTCPFQKSNKSPFPNYSTNPRHNSCEFMFAVACLTKRSQRMFMLTNKFHHETATNSRTDE